MGTLRHAPSLVTPDAGICIEVSPPDDDDDEDGLEDEEDPFKPPTLFNRNRRKLSTPHNFRPERLSSKSLSALDNTKRRFSTIVNSSASSGFSRRLSATISWCLSPRVPTDIIRQGRALCLMYIRLQIRRSSATVLCKKALLQRIRTMLETECEAEVSRLHTEGTLLALNAVCAALERSKPELFRNVARQFTHAPKALLRNDSALSELALALAREMTKGKLTWSKISAVYCVCGALAREAAEVSEGNYETTVDAVCAPAAAISDLLQEEAGSWIATHGCWHGLLARVRASERDRTTERNIYIIMTLIAAVCVILTMLRWIFPTSTLICRYIDCIGNNKSVEM